MYVVYFPVGLQACENWRMLKSFRLLLYRLCIMFPINNWMPKQLPKPSHGLEKQTK